MSSATKNPLPSSLNAALLLADGTVFKGQAIGSTTTVFGEICFNTAMSGYQEVLTDPSYNGQVITFTFPHIGNVGCNGQDNESGSVMRGGAVGDDLAGGSARSADGGSVPPNTGYLGACGLIVREPITTPSNFRSAQHLNAWLIERGIAGISGVDTRALTRHIRKNGAQNVAIVGAQGSEIGDQQLQEAYLKLQKHPSLKGLDLASKVSTQKIYKWTEPLWSLTPDPRPLSSSYHVVAIDYGIKHNILRCLVSSGCKVTVVPANTSAAEILKLKPQGIFLSNGPGDPAATGVIALPIIKELIASGLPIFGICLGHQLLGLAFGGSTEKMKQGHRGANHPVKDLRNGKVEITSQNHGFVVSEKLPSDVEVTHRSLFDGTIQGLRHKSKPIFCVQGHPEASPGPHDSFYLFEQFVEMMSGKQQKKASGQ